MRRILLCLAVALAIAGCATPTVPTDRLKAIKSVAVISALGDDIKVEHLGLTVFTNSLTSVRVDWGLDAHMTQRLQGLLASRYEVRQLDYDPVPLLDVTKELALFSTITRINEAINVPSREAAPMLSLWWCAIMSSGNTDCSVASAFSPSARLPSRRRRMPMPSIE